MKKLLAAAAVAVLIAAPCSVMLASAENAANAESVSHVKEASQKASETLAPFAWYQFNNPDNFGEDTMGRFDLSVSAAGGKIEQKQENGQNYVSFRRSNNDKSNTGALLYAPDLDKSGKDFSDLVKDSFTVSLKFRSEVANGDNGSHYVLSTGRYNDAITVVPWRNGYQVQTWTKQFMLSDSAAQDEVDNCKGKVQITTDAINWSTVTIVGDQEACEVRVYVNGALAQTVDTENVRLSNQAKGTLGGDYTFAIGGQCGVNGGGCEMFANADVMDCKVFDYALDDASVAAVADNTAATWDESYIESLPELNTENVDFTLTDQHDIKDLLSEMPASIKANLSDGGKENASVVWTTLNTSDKIYGFVQGSTPNVKGYYYEYDVSYVVKLKYDAQAVKISDFKVGNISHEPTETVTVDGTKRSTVSFKLEVNEGYTVDSVMYADVDEFDADTWAEDDGYIYITTRLGAEIEIVTTNRNAPEPTPDPTPNPDKNDGENNNGGTEKKGCKGSVGVAAASVTALFAGAAIMAKKRRK